MFFHVFKTLNAIFTLTCDVLHFGQNAIKSVHCLQQLSAVTLALERGQDQHLAV